MFTKALLAAAAVASVVTLASTSAKADVNVDFGIGLGGFYPAYDYGYDGPHFPRHHRRHHWNDYPPVINYGISCGAGRNVVRNAGFRNVSAYDCSAPTFGYNAWRHGDLFKVKVNYRGQITAAYPVY
jgi:hypothetical protein